MAREVERSEDGETARGGLAEGARHVGGSTPVLSLDEQLDELEVVYRSSTCSCQVSSGFQRVYACAGVGAGAAAAAGV